MDEMLKKALEFVEVLRKHDLTKYAKHPRQDYLIALGDRVKDLQQFHDWAEPQLHCCPHCGKDKLTDG